LPPLTDEDYREVYEELLTYDPAPPSPTQTRLSLASASTTTPLLGEASKSAQDRISELLTRLNKRVPEGEVPLTPLPGKGGDEEGGSLASRLLKLRTQNTTPATESTSGNKTLSSVLDTTEEGAQADQSESASPESPSEQSASHTPPQPSPPSISTRPQSLLSRQHARQRGKIFHALNILLRPTPGTKPDPKTLIVGEQPKDMVKVDLATKQEWSALVLEASNDRNLTDVLTTFELMKVSRIVLCLLLSLSR